MVPLSRYASSFRETSYDRTKDESLLGDIRHTVYNLDAIASDLCSRLREGENLSSADGVFLWKDRLLLLEFKNQKLSQIERRRIRKKAFDSPYLLLQTDVLEKVSLASLREKLVFVLLYRENDITSFSSFRRRVGELAGMEDDQVFGLSEFSGFYRETLVMTAEEFWTCIREERSFHS